MPVDRQSGKLKGFSFITYAHESDCKKALLVANNEKLELDGRRLRVTIAENRNDN